MWLAMLQKRRITVEKGAVPEGDADALDALYAEANKLDGFMVVEDGGIKKLKIEEMANLSEFQAKLMQQSELEIREIAGTPRGAMGYEEPGQSGVAKNIEVQRATVTTATLFDNLRRSMKQIGEQNISNIQTFWRYEKVLRVTDRLTGAERFITVNQAQEGGMKNNITQGKFDCVVSETPSTDTIREKNMEILYAAIEKSPPEAVPTLLIAAFEMSDLPNKELLLEKLKPILGIEPENEDITAEEKKQQVLEQLEAHKEQQQMVAQLEMEGMKAQLQEAQLKNAETQLKMIELEAKIAKLVADTQQTVVNTELAVDGHELDVDKHELDIDKHELDIDIAQVDALEKGVDVALKSEGGNGDKQATGNA